VFTDALDDAERREVLPFIPASARSILDVGCGAGVFGALLRAARPELRLVGLDPKPPRPQDVPPYDDRLTGLFPSDLPDEQFDCIVFNDVLEHMVDPWQALRAAHRSLTPNGTVVASIPNVRNIPHVVAPLLLRGRWTYRDNGILNVEHLRFFTRATITEMFVGCGYSVEQLEPINRVEAGRWATLNRWLAGRLDDLLAVQFAVVARPLPSFDARARTGTG